MFRIKALANRAWRVWSSDAFRGALFAMGAGAALGAMASFFPGPPAKAQAGAIVKATHGDWQVRCEGGGICFMTQTHVSTEGEPEAVFTVIRPRGIADDTGAPVMALAEIAVPLGVYLPAGLGVSIDAGKSRVVPFERCVPTGCVVRAQVSQEMLDSLKRGAVADVIVMGGPEDRLKIPMSLKGFTAAFDAL